jgi:hypothetical protein
MAFVAITSARMARTEVQIATASDRWDVRQVGGSNADEPNKKQFD